jgi:hypothetical protein
MSFNAAQEALGIDKLLDPEGEDLFTSFEYYY